MNTWLQFLTANGAQLSGDATPKVIGFPTVDVPTDMASFVSPLVEYGLIAVTGEDAASFLHNQFTNDVEHLGVGEARLAGYCSPKGRMLASFVMWKTTDGIMLLLSRDILPTVQKRLQMFVLRSKVKLADVTEQHVLLGAAGNAATTALQNWFTDMPAKVYAKTEAAAGTLIRIADAFGPRYLWIANAETAQQAWPTLTQMLTPVGSQAWKRTEIHAGVPNITKETQEQFVPQMVNYDLIGGVSFKKGCYPGQEIVARTHYLGKVKRRALLATVDASDVRAGSEIFNTTEPDQPCGMVINAARNVQGDTDCLVEIKTVLANQGTTHLGSIDGPQLRFLPLPYPLPAAE
jgi:folate-binding protein YgfZ